MSGQNVLGRSPVFRAYLLENVSFLVPSGLITILFPWLIVVVLNESAERLGIAQMVVQLPGLALLLIAGLMADRIQQRRMLVVTHVLIVLSQLGIAALIYTDSLTFPLLLGLALFAAVAGVFSGPPRDAMLGLVAGGQIQRGVIIVIGLQFGSQIVGYVLASLTDRIGGGILLLIGSVIFALGIIPCLKLPDSRPVGPSGSHPLSDILLGLRVAFGSPVIRPVLVLTFALGLCFVGSFVVLLPLIVRDVYQGGAAELSLAFGANLSGTLVVIGMLMRFGRIAQQGRAFMLALLFGSVVLGALYFEPPYWGFIALSFIWGLGGGFTMTMGRSIVQESAEPALAARLLSIYAFAMSAGMPIGSLVFGFAAEYLGPLNAALLPAAGMITTVLAVHLSSDCWSQGAAPA